MKTSQQFRTAAATAALPALVPVMGVASASSRSNAFSQAGPAALPPLLYIADQSANAVLVYPERAPDQPIAQITTGISGPYGMRVDSHRNLYVANTGAANVTVYALGATQPSRTVSAGMQRPVGVAIAADGTLYVADQNGNLLVYPPRRNKPSFIVPPPRLNGSYTPSADDVAVDALGTVYVTYDTVGSSVGISYVYAYAGGFANPRQIPVFLGGPSGVDVDGSGDLVATFQYNPHYSQTSYVVRMTPRGKVLGQFDNGQFPYIVRLSSDDKHLYTNDSFFNSDVVRELAYPGGHLLCRIVDPLPSANVSAIAVSPAPPT